jgi:hypothetical protein
MRGTQQKGVFQHPGGEQAMFTGIVETKGKVVRVSPRGEGRRLSIEIPTDLTGLQLGDSINVNGACLTVAEFHGQVIDLDVSSETLQKTTFGDLKQGDGVNLERALKLSDRLGGHIVTGHIDATGTIVERREDSPGSVQTCGPKGIDCHRRCEPNDQRLSGARDPIDPDSLYAPTNDPDREKGGGPGQY